MASRAPWVLANLLDHLDVQLFLSAGFLSCRSCLQREPVRLCINAVTADPRKLVDSLHRAGEYGTGLVVLLVKPGLTPAGVEDRLQIASEVLDLALKTGFPLQRLYLDPVLGCRPDPLAWKISRGTPEVGTVAESISLIKQLDAEVQTVVSLETTGMNAYGDKKSQLQSSMLSLLTAAGLDAAIVNSLDGQLMEAARQD
jgi:cobalamin-dependent methionine synthase I